MSTTVHAVTIKRSVIGLIFAALGTLFLVLEIHTFASWILSPQFHATPVGADPVPENIKSIIDHYQIVNSVVGVLALLWFVQGIIRHRRIGPVRLMMVGWLSAYWLDPWLSFLRPVFYLQRLCLQSRLLVHLHPVLAEPIRRPSRRAAANRSCKLFL